MIFVIVFEVSPDSSDPATNATTVDPLASLLQQVVAAFESSISIFIVGVDISSLQIEGTLT